MKSETLLESFGYFGAALLIGAYALLSFDILASNSIGYQTMNLVAALVYGIYAVKRKAYPVLVVQLFWGAIGIVALVKILT